MKTDIHPEYHTATVKCACGNTFQTRSTQSEIHTDVCSQCHPFFTGKQRLVDTAGRVERVRPKLGKQASGGPALSLRVGLADALARAAEVERLLSDPATLRDGHKLAELGREHRRLAPVVEAAGRLRKYEDELAQVRELVLVDDPELAEEARAEQARLEPCIEKLEEQLKPLVIPRDPLDDRNAIVRSEEHTSELQSRRDLVC